LKAGLKEGMYAIQLTEVGLKEGMYATKLYRGQVLKAGLKEGREEPGRKRWAGPPSCLCISIDASPKRCTR